MKEKFETQLKNTMEKQTPDSLDAILRRLEQEKGTVMENKITKRNKFSLAKRITAIAAAIALVLAVGFAAVQFMGNKTVSPAAVIAFDVNPSMELEINKNEEVIKVNTLNDDAKTVIGDMKLEGVDLDVAVNAIVGSMLKNNYLSVERNSILVSVKADNHEKAEALQKNISADITAMLAAGNIEASVLTQKYDGDASAKAEENKISAAKAALIDKIIAAGLKDASGQLYTYERLAAMSVNELKLVLESKEVQLENVGTTGSASADKYITAEEAIEIAVKHAQITDTQYKALAEMDYDDGMMLYEIDIFYNNTEYEYEINAETGAVVKYEQEAIKDNVGTPSEDVVTGNPNGDKFVTKDDAINAAINHAGVDKASVAALRTELDTDDKTPHYDVEFMVGNVEYEYEVAASTGKIIKFEKEVEEDNKHESNITANIISKEEALAIAYKDAGVAADSVYVIKCELDKDDGKYKYDAEFKVGNTEYDYEINAVTGKIVDKDIEIEKPVNGGNTGEGTDVSEAGISRDKAISIALSHAGFSASAVTELECEYDVERGKQLYEVSFKNGRTEYDYEIDANTGDILKSEKEIDD